jgi:hypothetical protein
MAVLFALAAFSLLAGERVRRNLMMSPFNGRSFVFYLAFNCLLYVFFFQYTLSLDQGSSWGGVVVWALAAVTVGMTAFLTFYSLQSLTSLMVSSPIQVLGATAIGVALGFGSPWFQSLWPAVCGPALTMDRVLLRATYGAGEAVTGRNGNGFPLLGTGRLLLLVTPQCSELEAIPALWLLGAAAAFVRWRILRKLRWALLLVGGTILFYLLIAVRLFGLIVIGMNSSVQVAVNLAHSRISGMLFLVLAVLFVAAALRYGCRVRSPRS